jgi:hypothetical protein
MPPDLRKASGFPASLKLFFEAAPQDLRDAATKTGKGMFPERHSLSAYQTLALRSPSTDLNWPYFQAQQLADRMSVTMTAGMQYLTDVLGKRTGVILSLEQYEKLVEDVHDLAVVGDRLDEEPITLEELKERLRLSPC